MSGSAENDFAHEREDVPLLTWADESGLEFEVGVGFRFPGQGGLRPAVTVSGPDKGLWWQEHESVFDGVDHLPHGAAGKIGAANGANKEGVAGKAMG
jgi:hypothetical protein